MSDSVATTSISADDSSKPQLKDLLKNRNFTLLWLAQVISDFGDSLTNLALLVIVTRLTGSTAALATMLIVLTIPQITFGLVAGVYVDRLDRKRIMIVSDLLRGLLVLSFTLVSAPDRIWLLYLVGFVQATIGTFFTPARGALMPNLVPSSSLMAANSLSQTSRIIMNVLGAGAAGVLIGVFDSYWPVFTTDSLTFFASVLLVIRIVAPPRLAATQQAEAGGSRGAAARLVLVQLKEGIGVIFHNRLLLGTLVAAAVGMLGIGAVNVLIIPLTLNDLKVPATWLGGIDLAQTVGMVLSGGAVALLAFRFKPARIVSISLALLGLLIGVTSLVTSIWHLLPLLFVVGLVVTPFQASIATIMQTSVADSVRGRIASALNTLISTASLISMGFAGLFAEAIGVRNVFVASGFIAILAGFASAWVFRGIRAETPTEVRADAEVAAGASQAQLSPSGGSSN